MEQYNEQSARNVINQAKELAGGKKEAKPVASATMAKKSGFKKFFDNFIASDAKDIRDHVVWDILVPSAKNTAYSMVMNALGMTLGINGKGYIASNNGGSRLDRTPSGSIVSYKNYSNCYDTSNVNQPSSFRRYKYNKNRFSFEDLGYDTIEECNNVLFELDGWLDQYSYVSVANFYRFSGIDEGNIDFTDESWGWYDLKTNRPTPYFANGKWHLNMPEPVPYSG